MSAHPVKWFRKWEPSNSSDGVLMESWCERCERDAGFPDTNDGCEIAARAYRNSGAAQLVLDDDGHFMCTAFVPAGETVPFLDTRTLDLFA